MFTLMDFSNWLADRPRFHCFFQLRNVQHGPFIPDVFIVDMKAFKTDKQKKPSFCFNHILKLMNTKYKCYKK